MTKDIEISGLPFTFKNETQKGNFVKSIEMHKHLNLDWLIINKMIKVGPDSPFTH